MSEINEQKIYTVKHGLNKFVKGFKKNIDRLQIDLKFEF